MTGDELLLSQLLKAIASNDDQTVYRLLDDYMELARCVVGKTQEYFLPEVLLQVYAGDTALHVAAAAYRTDLARKLLSLGADIRAQNRRGAEPLHSATVGSPVSHHWNPDAQAETIAFLISMGADPNAVDKNGVTPLHRAIRNRCAAAVRALLAGGADAARKNKNGSTVMTLATHTTGKGGSGSAESKAQQAEIIRLLEQRIV